MYTNPIFDSWKTTTNKTGEWLRQVIQLLSFSFADTIFPDGKINIHFDGWTARYDYVCDPKDPALHPVGFMQCNQGQLKERVNRELQIPNSKAVTVFIESTFSKVLIVFVTGIIAVIINIGDCSLSFFIGVYIMKDTWPQIIKGIHHVIYWDIQTFILLYSGHFW